MPIPLIRGAEKSKGRSQECNASPPHDTLGVVRVAPPGPREREWRR